MVGGQKHHIKHIVQKESPKLVLIGPGHAVSYCKTCTNILKGSDKEVSR